ncbi:MAG: hypothetical protein IT305_26810 [Chloroflexi bacterium]|nr:hypothetical protein [Chloroflexota bacterium]
MHSQPDLRRRVDWLLFELTTRGDAGRPKGIVGPSALVVDAPSVRWRRSGVGGFHYYAWWFPAGGWDSIDDPSTIVVRAVRHHDEMRPLGAGSPTDYEPRAFDQLDPLTDEQRQVLSSGARVRLVVGQPGTGKTGALLFTAIAEARHLPPDQRLLYVTLSRRLAGAAEEILHGTEGVSRRVEVVPLADLLARWGGLGGGGSVATSEEDEERAFRGSVGGFAPRDLSIWHGSDRALWAEVRAYILGSALPFPLRDQQAATEPLLRQYTYEKRRARLLGSRAATAAWRAARGFVDRRDLPSVQREAWEAIGRLERGALDRELRGIGGIIVDEIQDLTLVQIAALAMAARRRAELGGADGTGLAPLFVAAGDESQVVHPSGFDWGWCKDVLTTLLGTAPEEISLRQNQRSPAPLIEVANRTTVLYDELPKDYRPKGACQAEKTSAPSGEVGEVALAVVAPDDADLTGWLTLLADTPHNAVVTAERLGGDTHSGTRGGLSDGPSTGARSESEVSGEDGLQAILAEERFQDLRFTPGEVKGLDRQYVVLWDASRTLAALRAEIEAGRQRGQQLRFLVARTAIDELRVAVSRATETLILLDPPDAEIDPLVQGLLDDGLAVRRSVAFLRARLEERSADARERSLGFLEDALGLLESDPERALRTLVRVDAALAGLVDVEQRREALERSLDIRRGMATALGQQGRYGEAAEQFERLVVTCRELGQQARADQYSVLARRYAEAPPGSPQASKRLPDLLVEYVRALEGRAESDRTPRLFEIPRDWLAEARDLGLTDSRALDSLYESASGLADLSDDPRDREAAEALADALADARLDARDWSGAIALLEGRAEASSERLARAYEGLKRWSDAAIAREAAGQFELALTDRRRAGAFAEAAALAERIGREEEAGRLGRLADALGSLGRLGQADLDLLEEDEAGTLGRRLREALDRLSRRKRRR